MCFLFDSNGGLVNTAGSKLVIIHLSLGMITGFSEGVGFTVKTSSSTKTVIFFF